MRAAAIQCIVPRLQGGVQLRVALQGKATPVKPHGLRET